ncbi:MAG: hypothetical protein ACKVP7_27810 [Hyphomicrobiaceae bacterium]
MRYQLEYVRQGLCVLGYDVGTPWLAVSSAESVESFDVFGPEGQERAWVMIDSGPDKRLVLLDIPQRRRLGVIALDHPHERALASRDGRYVHVLSNGKVAYDKFPTNVELVIIDVAAARAIAVHKATGVTLAPFACHAVLMPDGRVRFAAESQGLRGLATINSVSGECAFAPLPAEVRTLHIGHTWLSPSGRYALRPNLASLPILAEMNGRRCYGATMQLWETSPLRYVRTLTCAWLDETELPQFNPPPPNGPENDFGSRVAVEAVTLALWRIFGRAAYGWRNDLMARADALQKQQEAVARMEPPLRQIARALSDHPKDSLGPPPLTAERVTLNPLRQPVVEAHWAFSELVSDFKWQPDETAFWCQVYNFWVCVGLDGRTSSRIRLARSGMDDSMIMPRANGPDRVEVVDGRKARFTYMPPHVGTSYAATIIDGAPVERPWEINVIPEEEDGLAPLPFVALPDDFEKKFAVCANDMHVLRVPLASRKRGACIASLVALTGLFDNDQLKHRYGSELDFAFELPNGTLIDTKSFFRLVEQQGAPTVPALRGLLETFLAMPYAKVWAEHGPCLMHAVRALALLDPDALPTIRRYPLDFYHNSWPAELPFPAMIRAHGWNDERVEFVLDEVVLNYIGHDWGIDMWCKHGLREAIAERYSPKQFVERTYERLNPFKGEDATDFVKNLAPLTAWEREAFRIAGFKVPE